MDYTAEDALEAGFRGVALIVREEVRQELLDHIATHWPSELTVEPVIQGPIAGTAQAVASAGGVVEGSFGVVNADDLYGKAGMQALAKAVAECHGDTHAIVGYRLANSILTDAPVTRGVCSVGDDGALVRIVEQNVVREANGYSGKAIHAPATEARHALTGEEVVSMNLWGFSPSIFGELDAALDAFEPETAPHSLGKPPELLLPTVVGNLVEAGRARVLVTRTEGRCIGLTHPDDLPLVRDIVAAERHHGESTPAT
jgi:hypothetical protein